MNISAVIDASALEKRLKSINLDLAVYKAFSKTAQQGINVILDRTAKGLGIYAPFKSYSNQYAAFRADKGRSTNPDLNFSGKMLGSMKSRVKLKERAAYIYFSRSAEAKKAVANNKLRPFFGFNDREKNKLIRFFRKNLNL